MDLPPFGIKNLGNTCFFSSVIQCIMRSDDLFDRFRKKSIHDALDCNTSRASSEVSFLQQMIATRDKLAKRVDAGANELILEPVTLYKLFMNYGATHRGIVAGHPNDAAESIEIIIRILFSAT